VISAAVGSVMSEATVVRLQEAPFAPDRVGANLATGCFLASRGREGHSAGVTWTPQERGRRTAPDGRSAASATVTAVC
jgi:hypothetical protein